MDCSLPDVDLNMDLAHTFPNTLKRHWLRKDTLTLLLQPYMLQAISRPWGNQEHPSVPTAFDLVAQIPLRCSYACFLGRHPPNIAAIAIDTPTSKSSALSLAPPLLHQGASRSRPSVHGIEFPWKHLHEDDSSACCSHRGEGKSFLARSVSHKCRKSSDRCQRVQEYF